MANDIFTTVAQCESCAQNGNQYRHKRPLQLFSASGPLNFVAMDILGLPPKTTQVNRYVLVLTNRYSKLMKAILTSTTNVTHIAN